MALGYSWNQLVQRVRRHIVNDFPSAELNIATTEVLLYINDAMASNLVGQVWTNAKMLGEMEVPEAYDVTFQLSALQQDPNTNYWYSTMPQPPLGLPLGYSVTRVYFANKGDGEGTDVMLIKSKRVGYRKNMPIVFGVRAWFENGKIWMAASDGSSLNNIPCFIQMPTTRAVNLSDQINLPDDAVEMIFTKVIARLKDRLQLPQDIVKDDISPGNKGS